MSDNFKLLTAHGLQVGSSVGDLYEVPADKMSFVNAMKFHNINTSEENLKLYLVDDESGVTDDTKLFLNIDLPVNETIGLNFGFPFVLNTDGDKIRAVTDTASKVNAILYGAEEDPATGNDALYKLLSGHGSQIAAAAASIFTVQADTQARIKKVWLHNTNTTTENVKLYLVENGGSANAARLFFDADLVANASVEIISDFPDILNNVGDSIRAETTTAGKVNPFIFGREDPV
jgi:hypothetical protein